MLLSSYLYQLGLQRLYYHFPFRTQLCAMPACNLYRIKCVALLGRISVLASHNYFQYRIFILAIYFFNLSYLGFMQSSIYKEQINKHYRKNNCASNRILVAKTTISLPPAANNGIRGNVSHAVYNSFCPMIFRYFLSINFPWLIIHIKDRNIVSF